MPIDRDTGEFFDAVAGVRLEVKNSTRQLVVVRCPFCKATHRHGAGSPLDPIELYLGLRDVDCAPPDYRTRRYKLVLLPGE